MKKIVLTVAIISTLVGSIAIVSNNKNDSISNQNNLLVNSKESTENNNSNYKKTSAIQSITSYHQKLYNNIDTLIEDSSVIIKGSVIDSKGVSNKKGVVYTDLKIQVDEVISGNIEKGDIITLRNIGEEIDYNTYINSIDKKIVEKIGALNTEKSPDKIINYADGIKQYDNEDSVLLFLDEYTPILSLNPEKDSDTNIDEFYLTNNKYVVVGNTQGRFYYDENSNEIFRYKLSEGVNELNLLESENTKELKMDFDKFKELFN